METGFFLPAKDLQRELTPVGVAPCPRTLALCSLREARQTLPYHKALAHQSLPLGLQEREEGELVTLVTPLANTLDGCSLLKFLVGRNVRLLDIDRSIILEAIFRAYKGDEVTFSQRVKEIICELQIDHSSGTGGVQQLAEEILNYAVARDATDVHLVPESTIARIQLRIRGQLYIQSESLLPLFLHESLVRWFKVRSALLSSVSMKPEDGSFQIALPHCTQRIRTSVMPTSYGEKVVLRLVKGVNGWEIKKLGFPEVIKDQLVAALGFREGLLLLGGPTGGGKTTTLYAAMKHLVGTGKSLVSVEDPVEALIPGVSQTSLHEKQGLSHEAFLRGVLRQDPDVVMLGEIRDATCAQVLLDASLSGHLTLSSVHGGTVAGVIKRFLHFGIPLEELLQSTRLIIVQYLQPILCSRCKAHDLKASQHLKRDIFQSVGCVCCDYSGYEGVLPVVESLFIDASCYNVIVRKGFATETLRKLPAEIYVTKEKTLQYLLISGMISWREYQMGCSPII
jgi:type II secretory ATPase GspE/PulE/Tfp pilus assembly ATPase PilB-like protein